MAFVSTAHMHAGPIRIIARIRSHLLRRHGTHDCAQPGADTSQHETIEFRCEIVEHTVIARQVPDEKAATEAHKGANQHGVAPNPIPLRRSALLSHEVRRARDESQGSGVTEVELGRSLEPTRGKHWGTSRARRRFSGRTARGEGR